MQHLEGNKLDYQNNFVGWYYNNSSIESPLLVYDNANNMINFNPLYEFRN